MTVSATWRYVRSADNPPDDITRGKYLPDFSGGRQWSQGPEFLKLPPDSWPTQPLLPLEELSCELRQSVFSGLVTTTAPPLKPKHYNKLSEYLNAFGQELHGAAYTSSAEHQRVVQQAVLCQAQAESFPTELRLLKSGKPVTDSSRRTSTPL